MGKDREPTLTHCRSDGNRHGGHLALWQGAGGDLKACMTVGSHVCALRLMLSSISK